MKSLDLLRDRDQAGAPEIPDDADAVLVIAPRVGTGAVAWAWGWSRAWSRRA